MNGSYTAPQEHGILVVFSGPSGAGKGTILKRYFQDDPPAVLSVCLLYTSDAADD